MNIYTTHLAEPIGRVEGDVKVMYDRRLMRVSIDVDLVIDMFRTGYKIEHGVECIEGIPPDAQYIGNYYDGLALTAYFIFYHSSFEPVPPGQEIPIKHVCLRRFNFG